MTRMTRLLVLGLLLLLVAQAGLLLIPAGSPTHFVSPACAQELWGYAVYVPIHNYCDTVMMTLDPPLDR